MNEILNLIGIVKKSGNLIVGYNNCEKAIKSNKDLYLIILAEDISDNTYKFFKSLSLTNNFKLIKYFDKKNLGRILGKKETGVIGVIDKGLSNSILNKINSGGE